MKTIRFAILLLASGMLLTTGQAAETVPTLVNYQGMLVNADNSPLATGNHPVRFRIWDQAVGGNLIWGPQSNVVAVYNGQFNVLLGPTDASSRPLAEAFRAANRFLELQVSNSPAIAPRQQILSAPFALNARTLDATNWSAVFDNGDPATGKIPGSKIGTGTITANQIATGTITSGQIADGTIQQTDLGTIYRLSASDGNPANALEIDAYGNLFLPGSITATNGFRGSNLNTTNLHLSGNYFVAPYSPATIDLGYRDSGFTYRDIRLSGIQTLVGPTLLIECNGLMVSNLTSSASSSGAYPVYCSSGGMLYKMTSSARYKTAIGPLRQDFSSILKIEPKVYVRKEQPGVREVGYLAEDLDKAGLKDVTIYDAEGRPDGIDYARLIIYANEVLKDHQTTIHKQQEELEALKADLAELKKLLGQSR